MPTIIISAGIAAIIIFVIVKMVIDKKNGKSACGCGCSGCASSSACHNNNHKK